jgi:predicted AAA+ superfamily ATPase
MHLFFYDTQMHGTLLSYTQTHMFKNRHIAAKLQQISAYSKVVLITGARQVGKSTILQHTFPSLPLITFDPDVDIRGAKADPGLFLQDHPAPIILDEIQYAPQLLNYIKRIVDQSSTRPQYLLTGSQNLALISSVAESMAGRVTILPMAPLTIYEQLDLAEQPTWLDYYLANPSELISRVKGTLTTASPLELIWRGGMPGYLEIPNSLLHDTIASYLQTYIQRDIRALENIQDIEGFTDFFGIMAGLTAQEINYNHLGREIEVAGTRAKKWVSLLKQNYQWKDISAYDGNTTKRISQKKKGYLTDTGIACFLQHISSPEALRTHPKRGALFETYIVNTIDTLLNTLPFGAKLYHWRSGNNAKVDLIIAVDNKLYPIEIKMQSTLTKYDARGIKAFRETYQNNTVTVMPGIIIYAGSDCYRIDEHVIALPWNCAV